MSTVNGRKLPTFVNYLGTQAAQPTSGSVELRVGFNRATGHFQLKYTLNAARFATTDAGASGSYGTLPLFTFVKGAIYVGGSRLNLVSCVTGAALDTSAGDVAYVLAVGSAAIAAAADGALSTTSVDIVPATATITNSGGTGAGSKIGALGSTAALDGTTTAKTVNLNWSGSAATSDANSTYDFTGTITICGQLIDPTEVV